MRETNIISCGCVQGHTYVIIRFTSCTKLFFCSFCGYDRWTVHINRKKRVIQQTADDQYRKIHQSSHRNRTCTVFYIRSQNNLNKLANCVVFMAAEKCKMPQRPREHNCFTNMQMRMWISQAKRKQSHEYTICSGWDMVYCLPLLWFS